MPYVVTDIPYLGQFPLGAGGPTPPTLDPDALDYIARVEASDGQALENGVKLAYNSFFVGTKADGDFAKLEAASILAGARTLAGALVPLKSTMPAPTNVGFVAGDRNRATGLAGGGTKHLLSNRSTNDDPQNDFHLLTYLTEADTANGVYAGVGGTSLTQLHYGYSTNAELFVRAKSLNVDTIVTSGVRTGLIGVSRAGAGSYRFYHSNTVATITRASEAHAGARNIPIFGRDVSGTVTNFANYRCLYYSAGKAISTNLRVRLNTLAADLAAALA